jgi:eukaryotic-like serine/threonine-protein kinase
MAGERRRIGKYEVLSQLTAGGMAELFLGFTAGPGGFRKYVVIKRILPDARENEQFIKMFLDEARLTAAFNHPNIAQVYDLDEDGEGLYLAMEFIAGQNLNQVMGACATQRHPLALGFSASVVHDLALALHYAHTFTDQGGRPKSVIHRDVAQKNVMVAYDGLVKLLDFGIAKARGALVRTSAGTVKGTTGYMSPEQVRGDALDGRSDIFSLGVVLWELLTGRRLFSGDSELDEMRMILDARITPPSQLVSVVPEELSDLCMRALARERADRFATARDFARAMELSVPQLLFDQENRARFMRELFEDKMDATRALLDSVGDGSTGEMHVRSVVAAIQSSDSGLDIKPVPPKSAPRAPSPSAPRPSAPRAPKRARADDTDEREAVESPQRKAAPEEKSALPSVALVAAKAGVGGINGPNYRDTHMSSDTPGGGRLLLAVVLGVLVAVVAGILVWEGVLKPPEPVVEVQKYSGDVPIPEFDDKNPRKPIAVAPLPPDPGPGNSQPARPSSERPDAGARKSQPVASPGRGGTGFLTLVTKPDATILLGGKEVGKTPVFKLPLPSGSHLLTLVGPDGDKRVLSVKITTGALSPFRFDLADLPKK